MGVVRTRRCRPGLQLAYEVASIYPEPVSEFEEVAQGQVPLTALDLTHEGPVQFALLGKRLLTEIQRVTRCPDPGTKFAKGWGERRLSFCRGHAATSYVPCARIQRRCVPCIYVLWSADG